MYTITPPPQKYMYIDICIVRFTFVQRRPPVVYNCDGLYFAFVMISSSGAFLGVVTNDNFVEQSNEYLSLPPPPKTTRMVSVLYVLLTRATVRDNRRFSAVHFWRREQ